jgi:hypothetical protein
MTETAAAPTPESAPPAIATAAPSPSADVPDLELLRRFEPVVHYTNGELFFPSPVERYLRSCDLWEGVSQRDRQLLVPVGQLTPAELARHQPEPGRSLFLRLVQQPLSGPALAAWSRRPNRPVFHSGGRLARVGLFARLVDAGFTASLLVRGTVPGGTTASASQKYEVARAQDPRVCYHARVVREHGWIVLHYLFFYWMNDYRSTFSGVNDHEADWEQILVYVADEPAGPKPCWIAAAAHDYTGDDLRRRWDDPTITLHGEHPVIFAGGGSHASYFEQGEYLTSVPLPGFRGLPGFLGAVRDFWRNTLRQPDPGDLAAKLEQTLSVPFVDYARGDGRAVGPDQQDGWTPILIDDSTDWVEGYRGLFGLDTHDRLGGERAPAGPKYTRRGTVRQTWNDPLGFAGLDKVAPPHLAPAALEGRIAELQAEQATVAGDIEKASAELPGRTEVTAALATSGALDALHTAAAADLTEREHALAALRARHAALGDAIEASSASLVRLRAGELGDPHAHLHHVQRPTDKREIAHGRIVEFWSAISVGLVLLATVVPFYLGFVPLWGALLIGVGGYLVIESVLRRRMQLVLVRLTLVLAVIAAIALVYHYLGLLIVAAVVGLALTIVADNLRELRRP